MVGALPAWPATGAAILQVLHRRLRLERFAPVTITSLRALAGASGSLSASWQVQIKVTIGDTATTFVAYSAAATESDYTMVIPAGTNLSTISVEAVATISTPDPGNNAARVGIRTWIRDLHPVNHPNNQRAGHSVSECPSRAARQVGDGRETRLAVERAAVPVVQ